MNIVVVNGIFYLIIFYIIVRQQQKLVKGDANICSWPSSGCGLDTSAIGGRTIASGDVDNHQKPQHNNK